MSCYEGLKAYLRWWGRRGVDLTLAKYQEHLSMEFKNVSLIFLQSIENAATSEKKL